jgi:MFS family permease
MCKGTDVGNIQLQAAVQNKYPEICAVYFLSSIGLGGNIPIDSAIALEFLPQNRRFFVALLGIWQPIVVVVASAIAFGTAAKYRCVVELPACNFAGLNPDDALHRFAQYGLALRSDYYWSDYVRCLCCPLSSIYFP